MAIFINKFSNIRSSSETFQHYYENRKNYLRRYNIAPSKKTSLKKIPQYIFLQTREHSKKKKQIVAYCN